MNRTRRTLLYAILLLLTVGYAGLIDQAFAAFRQFISRESLTALPVPTLWLSLNPLPWQLLAFASLLLNFLWALRGEKKNPDGRGHLYAAVLHSAWVLFCLLAHALGMLLPFVARVYVIK